MATSPRSRASVMGRLAGFSALAALVVGLLASPVFAQAGPTPQDFKRRVERWRAMTPEQRQHLIERYRTFKALPHDKQTRLRQAHRRWRAIEPSERRLLMQRFNEYRGMPERKKDELKRRLQRWRAMKPAERAQLRKRYQKFRKLPAPERRRLIERHRRLRKPKVRPLHPRPAAPPHRPPVRLPHRR